MFDNNTSNGIAILNSLTGALLLLKTIQ